MEGPKDEDTCKKGKMALKNIAAQTVQTFLFPTAVS